MKFKVIPKTNREDWLKWRGCGIGSSDVPAILGVSRYSTAEELLAKKTSTDVVEDTCNQYIKDRGNRIETLVRDFYGKSLGVEFTTPTCQNLERPHCIASLDGMDTSMNMLIEIKLLTSQKEGKLNTQAAGYIKWTEAREQNKVPVEYYPQIQHQLSVTGIPMAVFIGYKEVLSKPPKEVSMDDLAVVYVFPDEPFIADMNQKIDEFWGKVLQIRATRGIIQSN